MKIFKIFFVFVFVFISFGQKIAEKSDSKSLNWSLTKIESDTKAFNIGEPSGVEAINNDFLIVADDKQLGLFVVSAKDGKTIQSDLRGEKFPSRNPKWEAMAKDEDGFFYVIGAHRKRYNDEKILLRFKIKEVAPNKFEIYSDLKININNLFEGISDSDPRAEGLAIKKNGKGKYLAVGLRSHDVDDVTKPEADRRIYIRKIYFTETQMKDGVSFEADSYFDFDAALSIKNYFRFHLSSLDYVPKLKGFLIITATEEDPSNKFFGNAIWFMSDEEVEKKTFKPQRIKINGKDDFEDAMKAEGICYVSELNNEINFAVMFDNDRPGTAKLHFYKLSQLPLNSTKISRNNLD